MFSASAKAQHGRHRPASVGVWTAKGRGSWRMWGTDKHGLVNRHVSGFPGGRSGTKVMGHKGRCLGTTRADGRFRVATIEVFL